MKFSCLTEYPIWLYGKKANYKNKEYNVSKTWQELQQAQLLKAHFSSHVSRSLENQRVSAVILSYISTL